MSATQGAPAGPPAAVNMTPIIIAGGLVLAISFGIRSVFGAVLEPISAEYGWAREIFSLSLALQNLVWGLAQPLFGMIADRFGDRRALWIGFLCYLLGMGLAVIGHTPLLQHLGTGVLVGAGVSGTAFGLVLSVVGRTAPEATRSQQLGLVAAIGSSGQVIFPLLAGELIELYDWRTMLIVMAALVLPMALCIPFLNAPQGHAAPPPGAPTDEAGTAAMLTRAFGYSSYTLLTLGFFVCGFHVAFIAAHLPAYVYERCGDPVLGLQAIGIIGFMNILGSLAAGKLGALFPKNYVLSAIYGLRALVIFAFIAIPTTPLTVIIFAIALGPLWLSTVPLTSGLVASMFGTKHLATLYGFVFLSHQLGAFAGVWMGGRFYDMFGSYDIVWWTAVLLGVVSALIHLPVRERPYAARAAA